VSKYEALREHLDRQHGDQITMSFDQVAAIVPGGLPASAYNHQAWWANEAYGSHVEARAWLDAGFRTTSVSLTARRVTFVRSR
jgi:hypothetical protein